MPLVNNRKLPTRFKTNAQPILMSIDFFIERVSNAIEKLDPNKAH